MTKTRSEISREEMTRDPIFLLQTTRGRGAWTVHSVWLTREEAEADGYRAYGPEGKGKTWMVYGICANGELADVLRLSERKCERCKRILSPHSMWCLEWRCSMSPNDFCSLFEQQDIASSKVEVQS